MRVSIIVEVGAKKQLEEGDEEGLFTV